MRRSAIENSRDRAAIDFALANGAAGVVVSQKFGFTQTQVCRYRARLLANRAEYVRSLCQSKLDVCEIGRQFAGLMNQAAVDDEMKMESHEFH
jgi:hypothetical protein